ncbi:hypothetical protein O181_090357 [Austropuccinia psidii MF-1]|uniref:B-block binding subunit of TFIIIC domain-containing protein n=1 Tax=Austropuccinia psidii MF-1 TaxID=1389203 RepID=A0A9Q3P7L6_9BASI|nr:hypothetical protein [Austropuccinia psidii MF-1]
MIIVASPGDMKDSVFEGIFCQAMREKNKVILTSKSKFQRIHSPSIHIQSLIESPQMTAYVYQVLCIVAQEREAGATVIELSKKLKHDQKSLFHFVTVLIDLQLVVKFRADQHKAWTNCVVHRRYLNTSKWYKISDKKDNSPVASTSQPDTLQLTCEPAGTTQPPITKGLTFLKRSFVKITVKEGGMKMLQIQYNGCGIRKADIGIL